MNILNERDCLNALTGRIIKSAKFEELNDEVIILKTQDGLKFRIDSDRGRLDSWVNIKQVDNE